MRQLTRPALVSLTAKRAFLLSHQAMKLTKWYALATVALTALAFVFFAHASWKRLVDGSVEPYWIVVDVSHLVARCRTPILASAFLVGLTDLVRSKQLSPSAPALLLQSVGSLVAVASVMSWWGVVSVSEVSWDILWLAVTAAAVPVGTALAGCALLFSVDWFRNLSRAPHAE